MKNLMIAGTMAISSHSSARTSSLTLLKASIVFIGALVTFFNGFNLFSKTVVFEYDKCGNRIGCRTMAADSPVKHNPESIICKDSIGETWQISALPNPTSGLVKVRFQGLPEECEVCLTVASMEGRKVMQTTVRSKDTTIDISGQPSGIYYISTLFGSESREACVIKR